MNNEKIADGIRKAMSGIVVTGLATMLVGAMAIAPVTAATSTAKSGEENRVVNYHTVDRAEIENLQRWVVAGHDDWCKDARLVAAEEVKRIASDFAGDAMELDRVDAGEGGEGIGDVNNLATFEWTPLDGRATYRVTVERFAWLLPIAKDVNGVVWIPTMTEIQIHE